VPLFPFKVFLQVQKGATNSYFSFVFLHAALQPHFLTDG